MDAGINAAAVSASFWENGGYVASVFVSAGVALEFWEIFQAIRAGKGREKAVELIALVILIIGLIGEIWTAVEAHKYHGLEIARLQLKANAAINDAAINEYRLLEAWRESARDHLALQQMAKAVFPRGFTQDQFTKLVKALKGQGPVNIAYIDTYEASNFAQTIGGLLNAADIRAPMYVIKQPIFLTIGKKTFPMPIFFEGVSVYAPTVKSQRIAWALWNIAQVGGGFSSILPAGLDGIPKNVPCIIIGDNDAAFQPWPGQPGEGQDQFGLPVPAP